MSAAGIHYDHPSFDVFSETTAVNRYFLSGARLHHDHPSSRILVNETKAPEISESADGTHQAIGIEILCQQEQIVPILRIYPYLCFIIH